MSFDPEIIAGVCGYMNANQAENNLVMVQWLGGLREATSATMVGFDETGVDFAVRVGDEETAVRLPWTREISTRDEVREQLFTLLDRALAAYEP
jgi:putative heme iron utilization protein